MNRIPYDGRLILKNQKASKKREAVCKVQLSAWIMDGPYVTLPSSYGRVCVAFCTSMGIANSSI